MRRGDLTRWLQRRKDAIPAAASIEQYRDERRIDTYSIQEASNEIPGAVQDGDELVARAADGTAQERLLIQGFTRGDEARIGDRALAAMTRALAEVSGNAVPQLESVVDLLKDQLRRAYDRVNTLEGRLETLQEKLRAFNDTSIEHDRIKWEREDRKEERLSAEKRLDSFMEKGLGIAEKVFDGYKSVQLVRVTIRRIFYSLRPETHAMLAEDISPEDSRFLMEFVEEEEPPKKALEAPKKALVA